MGKRHGIARAVIALVLLLASRPCAFALDPALDINQYAHTAWKVREGFAKGQITSVVQTPDGYLWLGTLFGLLRFDGVKNAPWRPPAGHSLPSNEIFSLLAARDGRLWIGTGKGLASWKDGKLTQYPETANHVIFAVVEDHEGTIWASASSVTFGKLCAIRKASVECYGDEGTIGRGAFNLYVDGKGNLWAGVKDGLWRWTPGPPKFYPLAGEPDGIQALGEDVDGTLLVGWNGGLHRFVDGKTEAYPLPGVKGPLRAGRILRDRDGGLWIATFHQGLLHVHDGRIDTFTETDGLSGNTVYMPFQDREGNVWISTVNGIDRFRDFAVATLTAKQGLSNANARSVLADRDGGVWFGTPSGLDRRINGLIKTYHIGGNKSRRKLNDIPGSLFQDDRGRIWVSTYSRFGYLENDRFIPIKTFPNGLVLSIAQDRNGNLWVDNEHQGLFRLSPENVVRQIPWVELGHKDHASILAADPRGGLWLGFFLGGIAYLADGQIRARYGTADGLGEGRVSGFHYDNDGALWISTQEGGLSRLKNGRIATLTSKNGLPCDTVNWAIEDNNHSFWLYMACGLVRIPSAELDAWAVAVDHKENTKPTIQATVFDDFDGVKSLPDSGHLSPQVAKTKDGRIWFLPWDGVSIVDPQHLHLNKLPPPVHIEQVTANHKIYEATSDGDGRMRLPPLIRDLQIDYTALSLVAPEKVLFRYKLEGWDRDWQDVGTRRQAFYSNLPPRKYRFRVMACNNSGVWNEAGTSLDFSVAPAYYQTWWFRSLCVTAVLGFLYAFYQLRLQQVAQQFNMRIEGRVAERTRIARDLHDTLLQSFQGVLLKLHALGYMIPNRPDEAQKMLETVVEQGRQAIADGRDTVQGLRSSTLPANEIAKAIGMFADELAADHADGNRPDFCVQVEGTPRDLAPLLRDEIYRIGCEALRNAFRHAGAGRIEVEIHYDPRRFRLRVRDNGKGIAPEILKGGRAGHYGLASLHERAKGVGGKMAVWSEVGSGTEIELTIPASIAYAKSSVARESTFSQKRA